MPSFFFAGKFLPLTAGVCVCTCVYFCCSVVFKFILSWTSGFHSLSLKNYESCTYSIFFHLSSPYN